MSSRLRWTDAALPAVAVVVVVAGALLPRLSVDGESDKAVAVTESSYVCPNTNGATTSLGQVKAGESRRVEVADRGKTTEKASDSKRWTVDRWGGDGVFVTQAGRASGATGFTSLTAPQSAGGGLSVARCGAVVDEAWFLGLGTADKRSSTLVLANLSDTPAVADLTLWNGRGVMDAVNAQGVSVKPFAIRRIPVADLAAGEPQLAMRVDRRRGVLSAMVEDSSKATYAGSDAVSATVAPSRTQVISGIDSGTRGRTLLVLNPSDQVARIDVTILTADGPVADKGLQGLKVQPNRYRTLTVPTSAGSGPQTALVSSDRAVVAAMRVEPSVKDFTVAAATPALDGTAIAPVRLGQGVALDRLVLTALDQSTTFTVEGYDDRMKQISRESVKVAGRSSAALTAKTLKIRGATAYLTVTSNGGGVAAAIYRAGTGVSSLGLEPAAVMLDVPPVLPD